MEFRPSFPERGVVWTSPSTGKSHRDRIIIQSIMPPDTAGAFHGNFGWDAVNVVVQGLVELEAAEPHQAHQNCIEGGIEPVAGSLAAALPTSCCWAMAGAMTNPRCASCC